MNSARQQRGLPYSKSGGLADMIGALAKFLGRAGQRWGWSRLFIGASPQFPDVQPLDWSLDLPIGTSASRPSLTRAMRPAA